MKTSRYINNLLNNISDTGTFRSIAALSVMVVCGAVSASALEIPAGDKENSVLGIVPGEIVLDNNTLNASMAIDLSNVKLKGSRDLLCTPMLVNQLDTVKFTPFVVAGRDRWYYLQRNESSPEYLFQGYGKHEMKEIGMKQANGTDLSFVEGNVWNLSVSTPYRQWMENCEFALETELRGCAGCPKNAPVYYALGTTDYRPVEYMAEFIYVTPVAEEVKAREISGRAYVDFPVNKIVIYPDYRNNTFELGKITATIDSVKNDKDITVNSLHIAGTASPEGPYENNVYLAKNRTIALKEYVQNLYKFPEGFITTSYEPVDWKGLREWLEANNLENKAEILAIVNSDLAPFARNQKIKTTYPKQYDFLLKQVYPALRHSDYVISFTIRQYTSIDEILSVMQTAPQKLSLAELFRAANSQPEGSELYTEAFEIAVRLYPDNEVANLNAGIAAMKRNDYTSATKYLGKSGNSIESQYAKAVLSALKGDKAAAKSAFEKLSKGTGKVAEASKRALPAMEK